MQLLNATSQELDKVIEQVRQSSLFFFQEIGNEKSITSKEITIMFEWIMHGTNRSKYSRYLLGVKWESPMKSMENSFVVSEWLDDIGLPQYKEYFSESKIDGRLLHNLTLVRRICWSFSLNQSFVSSGGCYSFEYHKWNSSFMSQTFYSSFTFESF